METTLEKVGKCEEMDLPLTDSFADFHSARDAEKNEGAPLRGNQSVSNAVSMAGRVQSVRWGETCRFVKPY